MRKGAGLATITLAILLLSGCSRVQLAYNQLDWLVPYYVDDYLELNGSQDSYLDGEIDKLLQWHCGSQLDIYAKLVRNANRGFQQRTIDRDRLRHYMDEIEAYWKAIKREASPVIAELFLTSDQAQIDEFFAGLEQRNRKWLVEYQSQTATEMAEDYRERMSEEVERWFGPLTEDQQQRVADWSRTFQPLGELGLRFRRQWQADLKALFQQQDDEAAFHVGIHTLFVDPDAGRPEPYLQRVAFNQDATIDMLADISANMTQQQVRHFDAMARSLVRDFDQLACSGEKGRPQVVRDAQYSDSLRDLL